MAKILLVEDDNNLREIYEARLAAEGYEIVSAQDGEEALVAAKKEMPDLIIADVMMPRISGFEMLDILRNTEGIKDVKVIMLTALGQAEDRTRASQLGADRYLVKSQVTLEDIVKAASDILAAGPEQNTVVTAQPNPASLAAAQQSQSTQSTTANVSVASPTSTPTTPTAPPQTTSTASTGIAPTQPNQTIPAAPVVQPASPPEQTPRSLPPAGPETSNEQTPQPMQPATNTNPVPNSVATPQPLQQTSAQPPAPIQTQTPTPNPVTQPSVPTPQTTPSATSRIDPNYVQPRALPKLTITAPRPDQTTQTQTTQQTTAVAQPAATQAQAQTAQPQPQPAPNNTGNTTHLTNAVNDLMNNTKSQNAPTTAETTNSNQQTIQPTVPPPAQPSPPADDTNDDSVAIAHKKVIKPLSPDTVAAPPDLNELLANEGVTDLSEAPAPVSTPGQITSTSTPAPENAPHAPGQVIAPAGNSARLNNATNPNPVDPNSISL